MPPCRFQPIILIPKRRSCILVCSSLNPTHVDLLEINGHPQNRWEFARDNAGSWSGVEVNP